MPKKLYNRLFSSHFLAKLAKNRRFFGLCLREKDFLKASTTVVDTLMFSSNVYVFNISMLDDPGR